MRRFNRVAAGQLRGGADDNFTRLGAVGRLHG